MIYDRLPNLFIREMLEKDLDFAAACTAAEGWQSENRVTLEGFYIHNAKGCFVAEENEQPIGICVATKYGTSGFIGELIVLSNARGRGVGAALLNHSVNSLKNQGVESIYLDGVIKAVKLYERNGFVKVFRSWRFSGLLQGKHYSNVRRMTKDDLDGVLALDKAAYGADRSFFLRRRLEIFQELCYVQVDGKRVTGFIMGCQHTGWISAGPWVVQEDSADPENLLYAFALKAGGRPVNLGILEANPQSCDLVRSLGFIEHDDSPWRMVLGRSNDLGTSPRCYAIGSAAKG
jgi:GNAT superfamily N-acetyltransferase